MGALDALDGALGERWVRWMERWVRWVERWVVASGSPPGAALT